MVRHDRTEERPDVDEIVAFPECRPWQDDEQQTDLDEECDVYQAANQDTTLVTEPWRGDRRGRRHRDNSGQPRPAARCRSRELWRFHRSSRGLLPARTTGDAL